jgi:hypothetical protein
MSTNAESFRARRIAVDSHSTSVGNLRRRDGDEQRLAVLAVHYTL